MPCSKQSGFGSSSFDFCLFRSACLEFRILNWDYWQRRMAKMVFICAAVIVGLRFSAVLAGHGAEEPVSMVSMERVKYYLTAHEPMILVDLRPAKEFLQARIPGARSLPMAELEKRMNEVPKSGRVILYCDCPQ